MTGVAADVVRTRNNLTELGDLSRTPMVLAHGFGCDQSMWRGMVPALSDFRLLLLDHVGAGGSDTAAYDRAMYDTLDGYADDVVDLLETLDLRDAVLVGHSVSAMIVLLASLRVPERVRALVLIGPSPRYVDDGDYVGGFAQDDIDGLLAAVQGNFTGWAQGMAPVVMGNPDRPELAEELSGMFCRNDPDIAAHFAEVTFTSDNRSDLERVQVPTLVVQSREDAIAPLPVGRYVAQHVPGAALTVLDVVGHCPHVSHPDDTAAAVRAFLNR